MLSGVVGIVSGGASGLGAAVVRCMVRNGAKVVVADLGHQKEVFLKLAEAEGIDASARVADGGNTMTWTSPALAFSETDVTCSDQVSRALDLAESAFGQPVNAAISCAGIVVAKKTLSKKRGSTDAPKAHPLDLFSNVMNVNVLGSFNLARLSAERMASREPEGKDGLRGCIINTASVAAFEGQKGQVAYSASKGAVVGMTLPMARELAEYGIRVMTIVRQLGELRVVARRFAILN
jgi:3-hydroxyacyl-CoA dehydrogenase/3-hydroxy-2-methylbutyryl-CoA dehydrogenase